MISIYQDFAGLYDKLMEDVDYAKWSEFISRIFEKNGLKPSLIADLGCGTGSLCIELAQKGHDMIGIDLSPEMLSAAKAKALSKGLDILFLNQDMTEFELYGTVDAILCMMDSLNYVVKPDKVRRVFSLVNNYLNPGGLFIFDINSEYKLSEVLGNNVFYSIDDDVTYIWQNTYNSRSKTCTFDLTFFVKKDDGYIRFDENHIERVYPVDDLKKMISESGLELKGIYGGLDFKRYSDKSERIFFVCSKKLLAPVENKKETLRNNKNSTKI